jgi:hypothetical protein
MTASELRLPNFLTFKTLRLTAAMAAMLAAGSSAAFAQASIALNPDAPKEQPPVYGYGGQYRAAVPQALSGVINSGNSNLMDQIVSVGPGGSPGSSGILATTTPFMISGVSRTQHDGFGIDSKFADGRAPGFDATSYGFTPAVRWDASGLFGLPKGKVAMGVFGNYTHSDIDIKTSDILGLANKLRADNWSAGGFAMATTGKIYVSGVVMGSFGSADAVGQLLDTGHKIDTSGFSSAVTAGLLVPVSGNTKLDFSAKLNYTDSTTDNFTDRLNYSYTDSRVADLDGTLAAKLFTVIPDQNQTWRPFIQGGVTQRFFNTNEIKVEGYKFAFTDDNTTYFGRGGVDLEMGHSLQGFVAVRGDLNSDVSVVSGQAGLTWKLN